VYTTRTEYIERIKIKVIKITITVLEIQDIARNKIKVLYLRKNRLLLDKIYPRRAAGLSPEVLI
jgi:hypothetical protein